MMRHLASFLALLLAFAPAADFAQSIKPAGGGSGGGGGGGAGVCQTITGTTTSAVTFAVPNTGHNLTYRFALADSQTSNYFGGFYISINGDVTSGDYQGGAYWYSGDTEGSGFQYGNLPFGTGVGPLAASIANFTNNNVVPSTGEVDINNYNQSSVAIMIHGSSRMATSTAAAGNNRVWDDWVAYNPGTLAAVNTVTFSTASGDYFQANGQICEYVS